MTVNTKAVANRRKVRLVSLDDIVADVESLAHSDVTYLGNWNLGQICAHLAETMNCSIDGFPVLSPWPIRLLLGTFLKKRLLTKGLPAGFQLPQTAAKQLVKDDSTSTADGLAALKAAVERQKQETPTALNPGFGKMTPEDWYQLHLRHAELHLGFVQPNA